MSNITNIERVENMLKIGTFLKVYRINFNNLRLYVRENPFAYYSGLTGALTASTFNGDPDARRLASWRNTMIDSFGQKNTDDYVDMTASFGTLLHMAAVTIKDKGGIVWSEEYDKAQAYFVAAYRARFLEPDMKVINKMIYEYQKHVGSLMQFIYDRVSEIYAIEAPCVWDSLKICTPIDLVCMARPTEKGAHKMATINIKTSSQISEHQIHQAAMENAMWNMTYEDLQCDITGIIRTKDWREGGTPTYEWKCIAKTEAIDIAAGIAKRMSLCLDSKASYFPSPTTKSFTGVTKAGEKPEITVKTLEEEWVESMEQLILENNEIHQN